MSGLECDGACEIERSARELYGYREKRQTILPPAGVNLEGLLVGVHVDLDAAPGAAESSDGGGAPVVGLEAVGQVAGVIAGAVLAAVAAQRGVGEVGADLLGGGPEVVVGVGLVGQDVAGGDEDGVGADALAGVGHPEGVVQGQGGLVVGPAVEVPVGL